MDNVKTDSYYIEKIRKDLEFIVEHMRNVDMEELNADEVLLDSMLFRMIQISANAKKLTDEYRLNHGDVPWKAVHAGLYAGCVEGVELNMFTAGRAHARLSAMPTGPVREVNSGTGLSLCLKARAWVPAVNI